MNWDDSREKWRVNVSVNGKKKRLCRFKKEEDAALEVAAYKARP